MLGIASGFAAILCWWIGLTGYVVVGGPASGRGGFLAFFAIPALATAGTWLIAARNKQAPAAKFPAPRAGLRRRGHGSAGRSRHRAKAAPELARNVGGGDYKRQSVVGAATSRVFVLVIGGFAAVLLWWIGITAYLATGGTASGVSGLGVFLAAPAAVTTGIYLTARRRSGAPRV